ncbi:hypothetical protein DL764_004226 [Monosporascus ibericus]|uniref:Uncharacterized protein n=1 Tax=Monosporascus ibericus TaxID=155417 RepID=A0A4Q4TH01_9PEZI|nr:hypothetical protein DL764_004226 [Monosporascus ibericus]
MGSSSVSKDSTRRVSTTPDPPPRRETKGTSRTIGETYGTNKTINEIKGISKFIEEDRGEKGRAIIAVVPPSNLDELERSTDHLQDAIEYIQNKPNQHLTLLVSKGIEDIIEFHVPSSFRALSVFRCYHDQDREGRLLISGSSTFKSVRLDDWQGRKHSKHAIYLGDGVGIKVEMADGNPWALQCAQVLSEMDLQEVRRNLSLICEPCGPDEIWWKKIMGPMATILGLLTGRGKDPGSFKATAAGLNVEYHFGTTALTIATAGIKSHTIYSAAGPAAMLGFGAAMAAYLIPWDTVFMWLKGVFARLYQGFLSLWRNIFRWISEKILGTVPDKPVKSTQLRRTQSSKR